MRLTTPPLTSNVATSPRPLPAHPLPLNVPPASVGPNRLLFRPGYFSPDELQHPSAGISLASPDSSLFLRSGGRLAAMLGVPCDLRDIAAKSSRELNMGVQQPQAQEEARIGRSQRNSGGRCCSSSGRSIPDEQKRFGPTLAAEHLAGRGMGWKWARRPLATLDVSGGVVEPHAETESAPEAEGAPAALWATWCSWMEAFTPGSRSGPRGCLMNMVDDATGITCSRSGEQETIWAAVGVLRSWIEKYGVPRALYTDWKMYNQREPTERRTARKGATRRNLGACASGWRFALSPPVLHKRKGA